MLPHKYYIINQIFLKNPEKSGVVDTFMIEKNIDVYDKLIEEIIKYCNNKDYILPEIIVSTFEYMLNNRIPRLNKERVSIQMIVDWISTESIKGNDFIITIREINFDIYYFSNEEHYDIYTESVTEISAPLSINDLDDLEKIDFLSDTEDICSGISDCDDTYDFVDADFLPDNSLTKTELIYDSDPGYDTHDSFNMDDLDFLPEETTTKKKKKKLI